MAHHYPYTVMYHIFGAAVAGDVWYKDAQGVLVYVPYASFPWKKYLHPKKGAPLSIRADMERAYLGSDIMTTPGVIVEIWVNGRRVSADMSSYDPRRRYTEAKAILGAQAAR